MRRFSACPVPCRKVADAAPVRARNAAARAVPLVSKRCLGFLCDATAAVHLVFLGHYGTYRKSRTYMGTDGQVAAHHEAGTLG
ncbi:hypothetical protein Shyhy02_11290 [Streptomyces hygroscopicus subsp. hygroscopicus]|nr:hypothetical protein Shyhy02_11290 [Streptomyces hygroscopicus subsp. hygroscopicus]